MLTVQMLNTTHYYLCIFLCECYTWVHLSRNVILFLGALKLQLHCNISSCVTESWLFVRFIPRPKITLRFGAMWSWIPIPVSEFTSHATLGSTIVSHLFPLLKNGCHSGNCLIVWMWGWNERCYRKRCQAQSRLWMCMFQAMYLLLGN